MFKCSFCAKAIAVISFFLAVTFYCRPGHSIFEALYASPTSSGSYYLQYKFIAPFQSKYAVSTNDVADSLQKGRGPVLTQEAFVVTRTIETVDPVTQNASEENVITNIAITSNWPHPDSKSFVSAERPCMTIVSPTGVQVSTYVPKGRVFAGPSEESYVGWVVLPSTPVRVGSTWTNVVPSPYNHQLLNILTTLKSVSTRDGHSIAVLNSLVNSAPVPGDPDPGNSIQIYRLLSAECDEKFDMNSSQVTDYEEHSDNEQVIKFIPFDKEPLIPSIVNRWSVDTKMTLLP